MASGISGFQVHDPVDCRRPELTLAPEHSIYCTPVRFVFENWWVITNPWLIANPHRAGLMASALIAGSGKPGGATDSSIALNCELAAKGHSPGEESRNP